MLKAPECSKTTAPDTATPNPLNFFKDPYILDFLDLPESADPDERMIETALFSRLRNFLMELGKGFSFVGRQMRVSTETSHLYLRNP